MLFGCDIVSSNSSSISSNSTSETNSLTEHSDNSSNSFSNSDVSSSSSSRPYIDPDSNHTFSFYLIEKNEFEVGEIIDIWFKIIFYQESYYLPMDTEFAITDIREEERGYLDYYEFVTETSWSNFMTDNTYYLGPLANWRYSYLFFNMKIAVNNVGIDPIYKNVYFNFDRTLNSASLTEEELSRYREYYCRDFPNDVPFDTDIGFYLRKNNQGKLYFHPVSDHAIDDIYGNICAPKGSEEYENFFIPYDGPLGFDW